MAETSTSYVPGAEEANRIYQESLKNLVNSLDARKNQLFDPVLLAMAQGFGAPTKTGSFFESMGTAAGTLGAAQQEQLKQDQALAAAKFDIAGKNLEMERQRLADQQFEEIARKMSGLPPQGAAPTEPIIESKAALPSTPIAEEGGALPVAKTTYPQAPSALPSAPSTPSAGALPTTQADLGNGIPLFPPNPAIPSGADILMTGRFDKSKSRADLVKEAGAAERERFQYRDNGVIDLKSGNFFPTPGINSVKRQIYGQEGTFDVSPTDAAYLDYFARNKDPKYWDVAKRILQGPPPKPAADTSAVKPAVDTAQVGAAPTTTSATTAPTTTAPATPAVPERLQSQQELEARAAALKKSAENKADIESKQFAQYEADMYDSAKTARDDITLAEQFRDYAKDKDFAKMIGMFNKPGVASVIGEALKSGFSVGSHAIGLPEIEDVLRPYIANTKLDLAKTARFTQLAIQMQLAGNKMFGNRVTNYEERILGRAAATPHENEVALLMKADAMLARGQFNMDRLNAFRDSNMPVKEFMFSKTSPLNKLVKDYTDTLIAINSGKTLVPIDSQTPSTKPSREKNPKRGGGRDLDTLRNNLDNLLGGKP